MSDLNAVGSGVSVGTTMGGEGGNNGTGPIDNKYPTAITARGAEVNDRATDFKGMYRDSSVSKNRSKARGMGERK